MDYNEIKSTTGSRVREERNRIGKKQEELAKMCGVTRRTISSAETGVNTPGGELLINFAAAGMDVQYILTGVRSENLHVLAEDSAIYNLDPKDKAKRALNIVVETTNEMGLSLNADQMQILIGYTYDHTVNKDGLKEFIETAYEIFGKQKVGQ